MEWNELRNGWQTRASDRKNGAPISADQLRPDARRRIWTQVRGRDWLETLVALTLAPFFGWVAVQMLTVGLYLAAFFAAFLVASVLRIAVRLWRARARIPDPDPGRSVLDFLRAERDALVAQADLLSSVARWYWGPIGVGTVGLFAGIRGMAPASFAYAACVVLLCIGIEYLNRRAVRTRFRPAIAAVEQQIESIKKQNEE